MIRQIYVFAFLENAMSSQQEDKLFVQDGSLSERGFLGVIQEIKAPIHWVRKYSAELALGVFVITMLYVFGYMMNSNLPLNLSSTPLVLKISVLFSFVLIVVSLITYVVVCNGVVCGAFVSNAARRTSGYEGRKVIFCFTATFGLNAVILVLVLILAVCCNFSGWEIIFCFVFSSIISSVFARFIFLRNSSIEFYGFLFLSVILFIQAFVNVAVVSFLMKAGAVGFDGTKLDYLKSLFIFLTTGFVVVLFVAASVYSGSYSLLGFSGGVKLAFGFVCSAVLFGAIYFPAGAWVVQRILRVSAAGTIGCSVMSWSGSIPDGLKVLDDVNAREVGDVGAGHSIPVYVENDLGDSYVVKIKGVSKRQFYFVPRSLVSGMGDCPMSKAGNNVGKAPNAANG